MLRDNNRGRILVLLLVGLSGIAFLFSIDPSLFSYWSLRLYTLVIAFLPGILLALTCAGFGYPLVRSAVVDLRPVECLLFSFAVGMGWLSCFVALFGFAGALGTIGAFFLVVLGMTSALPLWRSLFRSALSQSPPQPFGLWQSVTVGAVLTIVAVMALAFTLTPPLLFDVTEYHLGAWRDYTNSNGTAHFIAMPHNFYARFPFPIESLYYMGVSLAPYTDTAPKVLNTLCVFGCGLAAAIFTSWNGISRTGQLIAALAAITLPVMLDVSVDAMIDAPVALLVVTAFMAAHRAAGRFPTQTHGVSELFLPALFLFSSALASKYTVAQLYLLPWLLICLPPLFSRAARPSVRKILGALIWAAIPCLVWFGKNAILYGNPLEPFFVSIFRPGDAADIAREKFYIESHFPQSLLTASYWTTLLPRLYEFVWLYLALCLAPVLMQRRAIAIRVVAFSLISFVLWNLIRESQDRFLLPAMVLISSTAVAGVMLIPQPIVRRVLAAIVILYCSIQTATYGLKLHKSGAVDYILDFYPTSDTPASDAPATPRETFLEKNLGDLGEILIDMRRELPPNAKVLLIYEARPYLFRQDTGYNVVWDDSILLDIIRRASNVEHAWQLLRDAGYTHVLVNRQELLRYIQQYARKPQLLRLGVRAGEDPRQAWGATAHPEDLYPPFYRDKDWEKLRPLVHDFLADVDRRATLRRGLPSPGGQAQSLEITVSPVP